MISVLIVDDHNIVRLALKNILATANNIEVVGEAETGEEAIRLVRELKPDVVLMDIQMPGIDGLETTQRLLKVFPDLKIIALTAHDEDPFPSGFVHAGAAGFLTKNTDPAELIAAIRRVYQGESYLTPAISNRLALRNTGISGSPFAELSKRELQVMLMILKGEKIKEIAAEINLSINTVSTYRTRVLEKLNVKNDVELTQLAFKYGILEATHLK